MHGMGELFTASPYFSTLQYPLLDVYGLISADFEYVLECFWKRVWWFWEARVLITRSFPEQGTPHSGQTPCRASNNLHLNRDGNIYYASQPGRQAGDSSIRLRYLVSRQRPYDFTITRLVRRRITYKTYNDCHQNKKLVRIHVLRILVKYHLHLCKVEKDWARTRYYVGTLFEPKILVIRDSGGCQINFPCGYHDTLKGEGFAMWVVTWVMGCLLSKTYQRWVSEVCCHQETFHRS